MGEKVAGFQALLKKVRMDDPLGYAASVVFDLLHVPEEGTPGPDGMFQLADELLHLEGVKALAKLLDETVREVMEERNEALYQEMVREEMPRFSRKGKLFHLTKQTFVQAKKELGGTSNPDLVSWLEDNEMGGIAKKNVNANSLRAAVNEWVEKHPIVAHVDGDELEGAELLAHLGLDEEAFDKRVAEHERLNDLVNFTEKPMVGLKAG